MAGKSSTSNGIDVGLGYMESLGRQADNMGPTWRMLGGILIPLLFAGLIGFMTNTTGTLAEVQKAQAAQSEQLSNLKAAVAAVEKYRDSRDTGFDRDLGALRNEIKDLTIQLRQVSLKLERVDARR